MNVSKSLLLAAIVMFSAQFSLAICSGEAQIIAQVESATKAGAGCLVKVSAESVTLFNENRTCPLHLDEVLENGFQVFSQYGHGCPVDAGQQVSGVLVKNSDGSIVLQ